MRKRLFDIVWSNESECQACHREEGTENTGFATAHNGTTSGAKSQRPAESGNKKRGRQRNGRDTEVLLRILQMKATGTGHVSMKKWECLRSKRSGVYQLKVSRATLQQTALFWVPLQSREHVVGQWCNWMLMNNWGLYMECTARCMQNVKSSAPSRGRS